MKFEGGRDGSEKGGSKLKSPPGEVLMQTFDGSVKGLGPHNTSMASRLVR